MNPEPDYIWCAVKDGTKMPWGYSKTLDHALSLKDGYKGEVKLFKLVEVKDEDERDGRHI